MSAADATSAPTPSPTPAPEDPVILPLDDDAPILPSRVSVIVLAVVFALLNGYPMFQAVSNLIALPGYYDQYGIGAFVPWWLLILGVVLVPVAYAAGQLLGRGRILTHRVLIAAVALAFANATMLTFATLAPVLLALQAGS